jgi:hypothetical protein
MNGRQAMDILNREGFDGLETIADELPNGDAYFAVITAYQILNNRGWDGYEKATDLLFEAADYLDGSEQDLIDEVLAWLDEEYLRWDSSNY